MAESLQAASTEPDLEIAAYSFETAELRQAIGGRVNGEVPGDRAHEHVSCAPRVNLHVPSDAARTDTFRRDAPATGSTRNRHCTRSASGIQGGRSGVATHVPPEARSSSRTCPASTCSSRRSPNATTTYPTTIRGDRRRTRSGIVRSHGHVIGGKHAAGVAADHRQHPDCSRLEPTAHDYSWRDHGSIMTAVSNFADSRNPIPAKA